MVRTGNYTLMIADCLPRSLMEGDWTDNTDNVDRSIFPALSFVIRRHLDIKVTHLSVSVELRLSLQTMNRGLCHRGEKLTFSSTDCSSWWASNYKVVSTVSPAEEGFFFVLKWGLWMIFDMVYWQYSDIKFSLYWVCMEYSSKVISIVSLVL